MFRIRRSVMSGLVCVRGGWFLMILISFLCILLSGWMYVSDRSAVPHTVMEPIRCGYRCR